MINKSKAQEEISKLIEKYERLTPHRKKTYSEADTRRDFIMPLFKALGWDVYNDFIENEVVEEETTISGRIDYSFRLNNITQFVLEAKTIPENLDKEKWAKQAIEYGWNKGITWVILTDFEGLKLFNSDWKKEHPQPNLEFKYEEYLTRFEDLWLLSKKSFEESELDKLLSKFGITAKREPVNKKLAEDLVKWRDLLTNNLKQWNTNKDIRIIEESVQRVLDRLLFIRVVEDRDIEEKMLWQEFKKWEANDHEPQNFIQLLVPIFRDFDKKYNSNLFTKHICEDLETEGDPFKTILPGLYGSKESGVKYRFDAIDADVLGSVYEQYLGHIQGREGGKSKRKKQGIYYTPTYIVDYIVQNTLGRLLEEKSLTEIENIKVFDPACGSGSFLIKAFDVISKKIKKERGRKNKLDAALQKYNILTSNIYGVDLDSQAVEIARLNLLLKALEPNHKLPMLTDNIKNGNSLIEDKKITEKALVWKEEFPEVFKKGGFDVIIGNPPYGARLTVDDRKYLNNTYQIGSTDTAILFIKHSYDLLKKGGRLGFIVPKAFSYASNYRKIRNYIWKDLIALIDCGKVWKDVKLEQTVFVVQKDARTKSYKTGFVKNNQIIETASIDKSLSKRFGFFLNGVSQDELKIALKIRQTSIFLNNIATNQRGAMLQKHIKENGDLEVIGGAQITRVGVRGVKGKIDRKKVNDKKAYIKEDSVLVQRIVAHIEKPVDHIKIIAAVPKKQKQILVDTINQITITNKHYSPYFIMCLLNSTLINWYAYRFIFGKAIRTMQFDNPVTSRIPIIKERKDNQKRVIFLVKKFLELSSNLEALDSNTDKALKLKSEVDKAWSQVNTEIYKLYNLTLEEIGIMEKNLK